MTDCQWHALGKAWKTTSSKADVLFPALDSLLGAVPGKSILDAGCGDGFGVRHFTGRGARCIGVDFSEELIRRCREADPAGQYEVMDVKAIKCKEPVDFVLSLCVLLTLATREEMNEAVRSMAGALKKDGKLIIAIPHPVFDHLSDNVDTMIRSCAAGYRYSQKGAHVHYRSKDGSFAFTDFHWMIEDYVECIRQAGLAIEDIREPLPVENSREINPELYAARVKYPPYIIFACRY